MLFAALLSVLVFLAPDRVEKGPALALVAQGTEVAEQEESLLFASEEAGFRILKPSAVWGLTTLPGKQGISSLSMSPFGKGAAVQFKVSISLAGETDMATLLERRDALIEKTHDAEEISASKSLKMKVAGISAPGLQVNQEAGGVVYTIRQVFFVAQGLEYQVQYHAPKDEFSKYRKSFEEMVMSFELVALSTEGSRRMKMLELANLCGSEVEWLEDWKTASRRAKQEKKLIVVTVQATSAFETGDLIGQGPLMDQDIVHLLRHRFIVLRWKRGMGAPFEKQEVFGMGPSTFGNGMLVVTPRGDVVRQIFLLDPIAVFDVLLDALQGHPKLAIPNPAKDTTPLEAVDFFLQSGQLDAAEAALAEMNQLASADASRDIDQLELALLQSELHRLRREGTAGITAARRGLALAENEASESSTADKLQLQLAGLLATGGDAKQAKEILAPLFASDREVEAEVLAPALMLQGALHLQARDRKATQVSFHELIDHFPNSREAWMASSAVTGIAWELDLYPQLSWPKQEMLHLAFIPELADKKSKSVQLEDMISSAADYLMESQGEDGSWATITSYRRKLPLADDFQLASAAIAGRALLRIKDRPECKASAQLALAWLIHEKELRDEMDSLPVVFMDYAVWSRSYGVLFLADCLDAGLGEERATRGLLQDYLQELQERQQKNGGWSYYLSGKAGGTAAPQSISFTTATVVMAFERAQESGGEFPDKVLQDGLNCLEKMRSAKNTFGYFLHGTQVETGRVSGFEAEASAARGPACTLALIRGERESAKQMESRMELFLEHLEGFGQQRRKALMHAGLHTQGSHYLLYDFSTAAEALRAVGKQGVSPKLHREMKKALLQELRACRNQDGSFVDNPIIGVNSGTGLALNALLDLGLGDA